MFNPEISRPAQPKIPVDMGASASKWEQSFLQRLLANLKNYCEAEIISPIVDYPDIYPFCFLMK